MDGPNVLLFVLDTARADRFVPHGGPPRSPPGPRVPAAARERLNTPMERALDGRFKLLRIGEHEALYDLDADPEERRDVSATHPERVTALRAALVLGSAPVTQPGGPVEPAEEAEIERHLEALGYL